MCQPFAKAIRQNYRELLTEIDTRNGLEGELKKRCTFPPRAIKSLWDCKDSTKRTSDMLDLVLKGGKPRFESFCKALELSGQEHIVHNYLKCQLDATDAQPPGEGRLENEEIISGDDHTFLRNDCKRRIIENWNHLVQSITSDIGLQSYLAAKDVFTSIQLQKLKDIEDDSDRNEQMLRYLEKGSQKNFIEFCKALKQNEQLHLHDLLMAPPSNETAASSRAETDEPKPDSEMPLQHPAEEREQTEPMPMECMECTEPSDVEHHIVVASADSRVPHLLQSAELDQQQSEVDMDVLYERTGHLHIGEERMHSTFPHVSEDLFHLRISEMEERFVNAATECQSGSFDSGISSMSSSVLLPSLSNTSSSDVSLST